MRLILFALLILFTIPATAEQGFLLELAEAGHEVVIEPTAIQVKRTRTHYDGREEVSVWVEWYYKVTVYFTTGEEEVGYGKTIEEAVENYFVRTVEEVDY